MNVECSITVYEDDGDGPLEPLEDQRLVIRSHPETSEYVTLVVGDESVLVNSAALRAAITNATHWYEIQ